MVTPYPILLHSCFLGFIQYKGSNSVGPFILNITPNEENNSIQIADLDVNLIDETQFVDYNHSQTKIIKAIQTKLEIALTNDENLKSNDCKEVTQQLKDYFSSGDVRFKITPLPFEHFFVNSVNKKRVESVDSGCQTIFPENKENVKGGDIITLLREQIQVLNEQNELLRQEQQNSLRRASSRPSKAYVIRKPSEQNMKPSRANSVASTDIIIASPSIKSENSQGHKTTITNVNLTNENTSLQEMLQEYMIENEALRHLNNTLEGVRASHHSEMDMLSRRNKELSSQLDELNKKITEINSSENQETDFVEPLKNNHQSKSYPISYNKADTNNNKISYQRKYDSLKKREPNEKKKYTTNIPVKVKTMEANTEKSLESIQKNQTDRNITNQSLLEELSRIDATIKEHIQKNQFNETLRNMGKKQNPRKK